MRPTVRQRGVTGKARRQREYLNESMGSILDSADIVKDKKGLGRDFYVGLIKVGWLLRNANGTAQHHKGMLWGYHG